MVWRQDKPRRSLKDLVETANTPAGHEVGRSNILVEMFDGEERGSFGMGMVTAPVVEPDTRSGSRTESLPPYHVVLLNDDDHSVVYVVKMLKKLFGHPPERGAKMAKEVHLTGRVVVATTNLEEAELKQEQIHSYGPDPLVRRCKGSMSATVEPASG